MKTLALVSLVLFSLSHGQTIILPFASKENSLEISVKNESPLAVSRVTVNVTDIPSWIAFEQRQNSIASLAGRSLEISRFTFSVDKEAPVGREERMVFLIALPDGESWKKEMTVSVAPPKEFELFQNYPNPFNNSTVISYQLTVKSVVGLRIYNLIGQHVGTVSLGERAAGYHKEIWDGSSLSSGIYVYELRATDAADKQVVSRRRMTLVK